MNNSNQGPFVKLQSGERLDEISDGSVQRILENLHPEYNARATFYLSDEEWVSVFGCLSEGFAISFKDARQPDVSYCSEMLDATHVRRILSLFFSGDASWKDGLPFKPVKSSVHRMITVIVICVVTSIIIFFVLDLLNSKK